MKHESVWPPKYIVLIVLSSIIKVFFCLRNNLSLYPSCMMVFIITSVSFLFLYNSLLVICAVILFKSVDNANKSKTPRKPFHQMLDSKRKEISYKKEFKL